MFAENWEEVQEVYGEIQAELLRGMLEAQGIPVRLDQEGAGRAYGLNVGTLGAVHLLVPANLVENAQQILVDYYAGKFEKNSDEDSSDDEEPEET